MWLEIEEKGKKEEKHNGTRQGSMKGANSLPEGKFNIGPSRELSNGTGIFEHQELLNVQEADI
jgi:hypothetical protein